MLGMKTSGITTRTGIVEAGDDSSHQIDMNGDMAEGGIVMMSGGIMTVEKITGKVAMVEMGRGYHPNVAGTTSPII